MEIELRFDPELQQPKLILCAPHDSKELQSLIRQLKGISLDPIRVWEEERSHLLPQNEFLRFYTEGKGVCAQTSAQTYTVRLRLYELEEQLDPLRFVRISNSEIVNLDCITAVDLSYTGTIRMTLSGGVSSYVSRRYVKKIKEVLSRKRRDGK